MKNIKEFLATKRKVAECRPVCERVKDYAEVALPPSEGHSKEQASRCMDCGTPFCHWGCPLANYIPEWNETIHEGKWEKAFSLLSATNNLPEVTGRICPALCEYSCVLGINDDPVTIRENELSVVEYAFKHGLVRSRAPKVRTGKRIAVVGSGPAGLSCADQLNKAGHLVTVFEKDDRVGGILRYGIPDFKLEKKILDRRVAILSQEGIIFKTRVNAGVDISPAYLQKEFDAVCLACGSRVPRDLQIKGRGLKGIHFAMEFLEQSNKVLLHEQIPARECISAHEKRVVVIGGGDTGADCVGTAHRQGARCVVQIEIMPQPSSSRTCEHPWPKYPLLLKTSSSHQEGGERHWSVLTKEFLGENNNVKKLACVKVEFTKDEKGCFLPKEIPGSQFTIEADLVILALGFLHPEKKGLLEALGLALDAKGNVKTGARCMTSVKSIFCAGDMRRGQSLIVWAIAEGRKAAHHIDAFLMGTSQLPLF